MDLEWDKDKGSPSPKNIAFRITKITLVVTLDDYSNRS